MARPILALLILLLVPGRAIATDLKITDSGGTEVVVTGAAIDYGGFLASDQDTEGIRVLQGDGVVIVKWTTVESLKVARRDESVKPARVELEIVLKNGTKVAATLLRQGRMKLAGRTDLGDYSIDLDKVRRIVPVR